MELEFDLYFNLTHYCNVDCPRCYLTKEERQNRGLMPIESIEKFLNFQLFSSNQGEDLNISWLGGEVTTIPVEKLVEYRDAFKRLVPKAKHVLITNLYSMSNKHLEFVIETFDTVETTYAEGMKFNLKGSQEEYKESFSRTLKKVNDAGLEIFVNVELNDKTIEKDPSWLLDLARETGQKRWEFDISVRFDKVFEAINAGVNPLNEYNFPDKPPLTISYKQWSEYVIRYLTEYEQECKDLGIEIGFMTSAAHKGHDAFFSTANATNIFTLIPNGNVFGSPVYSGIAPLSYGNVHKNTEDEIVGAPLRSQHIFYENVIRGDHGNCLDCRFYKECKTGFSSVPIQDGSGECVGMSQVRAYIDDVHMPQALKDSSRWQLRNKFYK